MRHSMKRPLSLVSLFLVLFCSSKISGQNILQNIEKKYGFVVIRDKIDISYYFNRIIQNTEDIEIIDKNDLEDFKIQISKYKFDNQIWNRRELKNNFYIINRGQKLKKDSVELYSVKNKLTIENKLLLDKKVKNYNSNIPEWRHIPISLSDIIYNSSHNLAMITINRGNDGGTVDIYQKKGQGWILLGDIYSWNY